MHTSTSEREAALDACFAPGRRGVALIRTAVADVARICGTGETALLYAEIVVRFRL